MIQKPMPLQISKGKIQCAEINSIKNKKGQNEKYTIRKRILDPILGSSPKEIIQTRLAKGEITLDEYEKLKTILN